MLFMSHYIAICSYTVTLVDIQYAVWWDIPSIKVCKKMCLFIESGELQTRKRLPCTRDETIKNSLALILRSWNHEAINLFKHRV